MDRFLDESIENYWTVGCLMAGTAIGLRAFGSHTLPKFVKNDSLLQSFRVAADYQLLNSMGILISLATNSNKLLPAHFLTAGIVCFSGSIYALVLNSERFRPLRYITPLGGMFLMTGWVLLGFMHRDVFRRTRLLMSNS
ncbi:hypothetical protein HMI54_006678 [Coelomomyces lativittatus]|nr:hypothetical protein HMI54_006678 [Coelomomyces lativittatus]KAJ1513594.1 hypothetical protein HMI55_005406 [Coelomomyces lativittatus]